MDEPLNQSLKTNLSCLRLLGQWSEKEDILNTKYYKIYGYVVNIFFLGLFDILQLIFLVLIMDDLERFSAAAYMCFGCLIVNIKAYVMIKHSPTIRKIYFKLGAEDFQPKTAAQKKTADETLKTYRMLYRTFFFTGTLVLILWVTGPLIQGTFGTDLPFPNMWYPFETRGILYALTYVHQTISIMLIGNTNLQCDPFIAGLMLCIGVEFDILADSLRNMVEFTKIRLQKAGEETDESRVQMELNGTLVMFHKYHAEILDLADDIRRILNVPMFLQFFTSGISLCLTLFQLSVLNPSSGSFYPILIYQVCIFVELFIYCWAGNEIIEKSSRIPLALYESDWLGGPNIFKDNLRFFMMRAQKPTAVYALDVFILSLDTPKLIFRAAWSMFTLLRQVNNK